MWRQSLNMQTSPRQQHRTPIDMQDRCFMMFVSRMWWCRRLLIWWTLCLMYMWLVCQTRNLPIMRWACTSQKSCWPSQPYLAMQDCLKIRRSHPAKYWIRSCNNLWIQEFPDSLATQLYATCKCLNKSLYLSLFFYFWQVLFQKFGASIIGKIINCDLKWSVVVWPDG